jgi:DNA-binding MarR family transcriptional regulator
MSPPPRAADGESAAPAPHGGPGAPEVRVLRRFRLVFNAVKSHFQQVEKKAGVGGAQLWALSIIQAQPGLGVNGLAAAMDIHQTTASNLIRSLAAASLVSVVRSAADRRSVQLQLLPAGEAVLGKAPGPFAGVLPEALASLDADTLERLDRDLARLIAVLNADQRAAGLPLAHL